MSALLEVEDLKVHFPVRGGALGRAHGAVKAVDGVSFSIPRGQTLGLVGDAKFWVVPATKPERWSFALSAAS